MRELKSPRSLRRLRRSTYASPIEQRARLVENARPCTVRAPRAEARHLPSETEQAAARRPKSRMTTRRELANAIRSEEHTSDLVCRLLLEKKKHTTSQ